MNGNDNYRDSDLHTIVCIATTSHMRTECIFFNARDGAFYRGAFGLAKTEAKQVFLNAVFFHGVFARPID